MGLLLLARTDGEATAPVRAVAVQRARVPAMACDSCHPPIIDSAQARDDLETLLAGVPGQTFRIIYDVRFSERASDLGGDMTLTLAVANPRFSLSFKLDSDGLDLSRVDPEATIGSLVEFGMVSDGTTAWLCHRESGKVGECQAFDIQPDDELADLQALLDQFLQSGAKDEPLDAQEVGGQRVAGYEARCFILGRHEAGADVQTSVASTLCVDRTRGLPLRMEGTFDASGDLTEAINDDEEREDITLTHDYVEGSWTMEARSVAFEVPDSDFRPPFPVTTPTP